MWLIATVAMMAACGSNDDNEIKKEVPPEEVANGRMLRISASMVSDKPKSRVAVDVTDPNSTSPDFTKGEKFRWIEGDNISALFNAKDATTYQQVGAVKASLAEDGKKAFFDIPATALPDVGTCRMFYPSSSITLEEEPFVTVTIPQIQTNNDFGKYTYMYSDAFNYDLTASQGETVVPAASFHHLFALLRFNVWNRTGVSYTLQEITIKYSNSTMLKKQLKFSFTNPGASVYSENYASMTWQNSNYKTENGLLDNASTTDKNEAVYDAMMVLFPTDPLETGTFTISMTFFDKDLKLPFYPLDVTLNCTDYSFFKDTGFQKGMRTYFCLDLVIGGQLKVKEISVTPWGPDSDLTDDPADIERPD